MWDWLGRAIMRGMEEESILGPSESGREAEGKQPLILQSETEKHAQDPRGSTLRGLRERIERFERSAAGKFWGQLSAADFMNSSFAFAALAVLCAFPLLAVSSAAIGSDIRMTIVARIGLNARSAQD